MSRVQGLRVEWRRVARLCGGIVAGAAVMAGFIGMQQYRHVSHAWQEAQTREAWMAQALRAATQRVIAHDALLTQKQQEIADLTTRLDAHQMEANQLRERISAQGQQLGLLQTELLLARTAQAQTGETATELPTVTVRRTRDVSGRVLQVNPEWNFVVVDQGWEAVRLGDRMTITRGEETVAMAEVERLSERACAARVLPGYEMTRIAAGDTALLQEGR